MCLAAFRYCMGRQSYIVGACIDWLEKHWSQFEKNTQNVIIRDIAEALMDGTCGSKLIDEPGWRKLGGLKYREMSEESKRWLKSSLSHKQKEFPFSEK